MTKERVSADIEEFLCDYLAARCESGDIAPEQAIEWDEARDGLADIVAQVIEQNRPIVE